MAQGDGFKRIRVTPAAEEDVVIRAGARPAASEAPGAAQAGAQAMDAAEGGPQPEAAGSAQGLESAEGSSGDGAGPGSRGEGEAQRRPSRAAQPRGKADDGYHETTLQDLESGPVPIAQKIVIIAAIILILAALAYYFVAMR